MEEIKNAILSLHHLKIPGSDGFLYSFYRLYWCTIVDFVREFFRTKGMMKVVNKTFMVLLPKCMQTKNYNHFLPISLCNFSYKVVLKILVNWLKHLLLRIISPNKGAFVGGHWIAENTVVAQELMHKVKKHKGRNGLMLVKFDLKKAYDRVEWVFVDKVLKVWGFSSDVRRMIFNCISSVEYVVLMNDNGGW